MRVLLFFHAGSVNRGCEAIIRTAVSEIKKKIPDAVIDLASYRIESDGVLKPFLNEIFSQINTPLKKYSFNWFLAVFYSKILNDEGFAYRKLEETIIKKIPNYDVFISVGGDNYCYGEIPNIYEIDKQIKKLGKKLVLWGASVGKEDLSSNKINDLKKFDLILARESLTEEVLKNAGCKNVKLVADGAFLLDKTILPYSENFLENNIVGFNYSPLVLEKKPSSKLATLNLIEHILETTNFNVCFVPHVTQPGNDDFLILKEFYEKYSYTNRVVLLPNHLNATEYKGYIARMRFFIGARTHATIAAYSTGVPTMVLGYSVKSKGIAKDIFGEEKLVLNIDEISDTEKLIAKFEEMKSDEISIRETLKNRIPEIKKMSQQAKEYLAEII